MPKPQAPKKSQTPIFKTNAVGVRSGFGLDFGIWSFFGIWVLELGA
jgi:hypothetical protein